MRKEGAGDRKTGGRSAAYFALMPFVYAFGTGGNYWQIGVKLDDGQTYYVSIGLR